METAIKQYEEKCLVVGTVSQAIFIQHFHVAFGLFTYTLCNSNMPSFLLPLLPNRSPLGADGEVETAHCTCIAGLGEACSHVASLLFYVEAFYHTIEATSCTQEQCTWFLPKAVKEVPYLLQI